MNTMHIAWLALSFGGFASPTLSAAVAAHPNQAIQERLLQDSSAADVNSTSDAQEVELDWDNLNAQLSTFGGRVRPTNKTDWMRECVEYFKRGGFKTDSMKVKYSTYNLKEKPSGLCTFQSWIDFKAWNDSIQDVLVETDLLNTRFEEIEDQLPTVSLPGFMSFPETAKDVHEIVKFANANSLKVSIKNSGHSYTAGSSSKDSLQINLRRFPKYSFSSVYECEDGKEYIPLSGPDASCKLALARGKTAVVRVGGGQGNDDMYRSVMDYNYMEPRTKFYNVLGGAEGMIGGGGGFMMGGGLGRGEERLYGSGADQVLELEMILPNGEHVKFGPTEWQDKDGYPQTTKVEGKCNANIHHDESQWEWVDCPDGKPYDNVNFADLWWAVRGGGGGTWGVLLSAVHNLHELLPQYVIAVEEVDPSEDVLIKTCQKLEEDAACPQLDQMLKNMWIDFMIDLLWNDENEIGVDEELSRHCGYTGVGIGNPFTTARALKCHGVGIQEKFSNAWHASVSKSKFILDGYGDEEILCAIKNRIYLHGGAHDLWHRMMMFDPVTKVGSTYSPIGKYLDSSGPEGSHRVPFVTWPGAMIPASLLKTKSEEVFNLFSNDMSSHTLPYAPQNDGMTPFAEVYHLGGIQTFIVTYGALYGGIADGTIDPLNPSCESLVNIVSKMEEETGLYQAWILSSLGYNGGDFPGYSEYNHIFLNYGGVLKDDPTKPCPFMSTSEEKKTLCLSAQETVWGSVNFRRLTSIKHAIDPNNLFDVHFGIGNDERPGPLITNFCAKETEPTVPPLTGFESSKERAVDTTQECKLDPPTPSDSTTEPTRSPSVSADNDEPDSTPADPAPVPTNDKKAKLAGNHSHSIIAAFVASFVFM